MRRLVAVLLCFGVAIAHAETPESSTFAPTISNKTPAPGQAPGGMVWIPGGEFSMGAAVNGEGSREMPMASNDSGPVHRVRGAHADKRRVSHCACRKSRSGFGCVRAARSRSCAQ